MRIIKEGRIVEWCQEHPAATPSLMTWLERTKAAQWADIMDARRTFPQADPVPVKSGRTATVFNIKGNDFRLITAVHYNRKVVFTMQFLTHAEYSKDRWKDEL